MRKDPYGYKTFPVNRFSFYKRQMQFNPYIWKNGESSGCMCG